VGQFLLVNVGVGSPCPAFPLLAMAGRSALSIGLRAFHAGKMVLLNCVGTFALNINLRAIKPTKCRFRRKKSLKIL